MSESGAYGPKYHGKKSIHERRKMDEIYYKNVNQASAS